MPLEQLTLSDEQVQDEAEDALEKDISNLSPASNSIAANLDGGVAAVDWTQKTADFSVGDTISGGFSNTIFDITGSGYVQSFSVRAGSTNQFAIAIDDMISNGDPHHKIKNESNHEHNLFPVRFDSRLKLTSTVGQGSAEEWAVVLLD